MTYELNNNFFTHKLSKIFQKHHWYNFSNVVEKYHFNYKGEIADYYLTVNYNYSILEFDYTLDIDVPKDKINDLLILISYVNKKKRDGFFIYDRRVNKVKFHINRLYPIKLKNLIIEDIIEDNVNITNSLFYNFTLATHNLIYAEKQDQSYFELMFMEIKGHA